MPSCISCGKKGLFLMIAKNGKCEECLRKSIAAKKAKRQTTLLQFVDGRDDKLAQAIELCMDQGRVSKSMLQRRLRIGYARAAYMIDTLIQMGIIDGSFGEFHRTLVTYAQLEEKI